MNTQENKNTHNSQMSVNNETSQNNQLNNNQNMNNQNQNNQLNNQESNPTMNNETTNNQEVTVKKPLPSLDEMEEIYQKRLNDTQLAVYLYPESDRFLVYDEDNNVVVGVNNLIVFGKQQWVKKRDYGFYLNEDKGRRGRGGKIDEATKKGFSYFTSMLYKNLAYCLTRDHVKKVKIKGYGGWKQVLEAKPTEHEIRNNYLDNSVIFVNEVVQDDEAALDEMVQKYNLNENVKFDFGQDPESLK